MNRPSRFFLSGMLFPALFLMLSAVPPAAANTDPRFEAVDKLFSRWDRPDSPGCALGIIQDGEFIYKRGYGMADLEHAVPLSAGSVFRIGSTSKQFTAMCIALLEEEGRLGLDDDIRKYIPEMPRYPSSVTIRHLIHHTSGIRDYLTLWEIAGAREQDFFTDPEVVDMLARQKELNFTPGEEMLYSNSGYFLLAEIVRRVTGASMRVYAEEKIFRPLGMTSTHFHTDSTEIVPRRACGYSTRQGGGFAISMTTLGMIGDGGVFTSVDDLLRWDRNFYDNKLGKGKPGLIERVQIPGILNSGENLDYAFGLGITRYKGLKLVSHGGAFVGFRADMLRFPDQRFSVICLANLAQFNPSAMARRVADIFLKDQFLPTEKKAGPSQKKNIDTGDRNPRRWKPEPSRLGEFEGVYFSEELQTAYQVYLKDGKLYLRHENPHMNYSRSPLVPVSEDLFRLNRMRIVFSRDGQDRPAFFRVNAGRVQNIRFVRQR